MPGIAGIVRRPGREGVEQELLTMVETMRHESHYSAGHYIDEDLGIYVGWTAHRGSFADCMPLVSRDKAVTLIFQGENYLTPETRDRLAKQTRFDDRNARYLLDLYVALGPTEFLRSLNGWYSGVVIDRSTRKVTLFNDRYGMGRIYIHEGKDEFLFSSEAKSLLRIRPELRSIDTMGLAEYLRFNCLTTKRTLFRGISLLPHAASWDFENGAMPTKRRYFDFAEWERQPPLAPDAFYQRFAATASRVFPRYADSCSTVALSLTAGLDTRAILASLRSRDEDLPCYTFGGPWGELFDIRAARRLSKIAGRDFNAIIANGSFLKGFPSFAERAVYISDGTHDAFGAHDVYLNEVARDIAPVRLTGKFGSEVVRVRKVVPTLTYHRDVLRPELRSLVEALPPFPQDLWTAHPLTRVVCEEIPCHEFGRVSIEQSQLVLRTPYMDNELVQLMFQAPVGVRVAGTLQEQYVKETSPELAAIPSNLGGFVNGGRLRKAIAYLGLWALFKVEYIYLYDTPHWLTRVDRTLETLRLERLLAGRQKWEGYRIWIKTDLADFIQETLLSPTARFTEFFERKTVQNMVTRHIAGTHNYMNEINRALTLELVYSSLLANK
jgi:asparagine synthase (glutamine-hydrolysing)